MSKLLTLVMILSLPTFLYADFHKTHCSNSTAHVYWQFENKKDGGFEIYVGNYGSYHVSQDLGLDYILVDIHSSNGSCEKLSESFFTCQAKDGQVRDHISDLNANYTPGPFRKVSNLQIDVLLDGNESVISLRSTKAGEEKFVLKQYKGFGCTTKI